MAIVNRNAQPCTDQPAAAAAWFADAQLALSLLGALGFTVGVTGATLAVEYDWIFVPVLMLIAGALTCGQAMVWTYHLGIKAGRADQS